MAVTFLTFKIEFFINVFGYLMRKFIIRDIYLASRVLSFNEAR